MGKITGVHHINLKPCEELFEKTIHLYKDVLGFEIVRSWGEEGKENYMLSCGDNTVMEIIHGEDDAVSNLSSINHIAFSAPDLKSVLEDVRNAGYEVTLEPGTVQITPDYKVMYAFFLGAVGESIELFQEL